MIGLTVDGEGIWIPRNGLGRLALIGGPDPSSAQTNPGTLGHSSVSVGQLVAFANHVEGEIHLPDIKVGMNPRLGMVAVPTWFWVQPETYTGQDLTASDNLVVTRQECTRDEERDASGAVTGTTESCHSVDDVYHVEVRLSRPTYVWDFGDGTVRLGTLGIAYPNVSDVAHAYNDTSLHAPGGYPVDLRVIWTAGYHVSGAAQLQGTLADAVHEYGPFPHPVQEAQAVLTGH
jgi:hypothetical protein